MSERTVKSVFGFDETVEKIQAASVEAGMSVLHVHPLSKTLESKGFPREPVSVIEVCSARHAALALADDVRIALMLPCPISVYAQGDDVYVTTMDVNEMAKMYIGPNLPLVAQEIDEKLLNVLSSVAG
jgi:uncharacterized protein (DUF302 family)